MPELAGKGRPSTASNEARATVLGPLSCSFSAIPSGKSGLSKPSERHRLMQVGFWCSVLIADPAGTISPLPRQIRCLAMDHNSGQTQHVRGLPPPRWPADRSPDAGALDHWSQGSSHFVDQVERRLGSPTEVAEPGLFGDPSRARLARLRAQGEADLLALGRRYTDQRRD